MTSAAFRIVCFSVVLLSVALAGRAPAGGDQRPAADPRVGLKPGLRDAGEAARNMEKVATLPKPEGFFDPKLPAGEPTGPERDPKLPEPPDDDPKTEAAAQEARGRGRSSGLNFANSDLAFKGEHLFVGNFHGFNTYDIEDTRKPRLIASVVCPGGQGDVSVHGNLLVMSVEQTRGRVDCGTGGVQDPVSAERFRGVRIFDISDVRRPKQIAAVQTCRGSHTHTLVTDPDDAANAYIYVQGTSGVRSASELAGCVETPASQRENEDPKPADASRWRIEVIKVPLADPAAAAVVSEPRLFSDGARINGLQNTPTSPTHPSGTNWSPRPTTDS